MKWKKQTAAVAVFLCLSSCGMAQPILAQSSSLSSVLSFSGFIQTIATALFASCVVGVWRMNGQLTAMNARLTNAVAYLDQRLNDQHQRLLYQERSQSC